MDCRRFRLHRSGRFLPHPLLHQLFWVNSHDNPRHHQVNTFKSYLTRNKCFCLFLRLLYVLYGCMHSFLTVNIATTTLRESRIAQRKMLKYCSVVLNTKQIVLKECNGLLKNLNSYSRMVICPDTKEIEIQCCPLHCPSVQTPSPIQYIHRAGTYNVLFLKIDFLSSTQ